MVVERIERWIRGDRDDDFQTLVAEAWAFQHERSAPLRRLAASAGIDSGIDGWESVPMVPALSFKTLDLAVAPSVEEFHSSGTTDAATPSIHRHPFPDLYRAVVEATFPQACLAGVGPAPPMLSLIPDRETAPNSSLAFMIDHAYRLFSGPGSRYAVGPGGVRAAEVRGFCGTRQRDGRAALVLGTTLALDQMADGLKRLGVTFRLPPGTTVFETGGSKGLGRAIDRAQVAADLSARLGLDASAFVQEYGMTELTSHCYSAPGSSPFEPPAWVRVRALDPVSLAPVENGEPGLLAIFDLANVGSALHVLTQDLGRIVDGGFELVGRARGAELRGCSLLSAALAD